MEKESPTSSTDAAPKKPRLDMPSLSAQINARFDVRSTAMIWYMLNDDGLDVLKGGAESLDFTFFGAFLAVALTLVGLAVPLYVSNQTGKIFVVCVALAPVCALISLSYFLRGNKIRKEAKTKIEKIKTESKTVLEMIAKEPL
jgi:heme/copper-type cytochrome/quinol oxidase subunit 4